MCRKCTTPGCDPRGNAVADDVSNVDASLPQADEATVTFYRNRMHLWSSESLHEELDVIDALEVMAGIDDQDYDADVVHNSAVDLVSQRRAIQDILSHREKPGVEVPSPSFGIPREILEEIKARRRIDTEPPGHPSPLTIR